MSWRTYSCTNLISSRNNPDLHFMQFWKVVYPVDLSTSCRPELRKTAFQTIKSSKSYTRKALIFQGKLDFIQKQKISIDALVMRRSPVRIRSGAYFAESWISGLFLFKKNIAMKNCICYNADRLRDTTRPQLARQEMSKLFPLWSSANEKPRSGISGAFLFRFGMVA